MLITAIWRRLCRLACKLAAPFTPLAEVIADLPPTTGGGVVAEAGRTRAMSRRPCTVADRASGLGTHHGEALRTATALVNAGAMELHAHEGRSVYLAAPAAGQTRYEEQA